MLNSKIHYTEMVVSDVDTTQSFYEITYGLRFERPDDVLGGAVVATLSSGGLIGIRASLRADEHPITRTYLQVDDIAVVAKIAEAQGALVALPPTLLSDEHGTICICIVGGVEHGFWQLPDS